MKLDFFNDTKRALRLHPGTDSVDTEPDYPLHIPPHSNMTFDLPDGCRPFVKLWEDGTLLVRGNPAKLPSIEDMIGLVPDITGGKTTEEYIRWLRDEEEKE